MRSGLNLSMPRQSSKEGRGGRWASPYRYSLTTRFKDRHIIDLLGPRPGDRILDVGCGSGYFSEHLARASACVTGVDVSRSSALFCHEHVPGDYLVADGTHLPFSDSTFDKILMTDVIEHIRQEHLALSETSRVGKPGALVVITTAALEGTLTGTRLNRLFHDDPSSPEYHVVNGYSAESLGARLRDAGIIVDQVRYTTYVVTELGIELLKLVYRLLGKDLYDQTDTVHARQSVLFGLYRWTAFPVLLAVGRAEERVMRNRPKGHIIIVRGHVLKAGA